VRRATYADLRFSRVRWDIVDARIERVGRDSAAPNSTADTRPVLTRCGFRRTPTTISSMSPGTNKRPKARSPGSPGASSTQMDGQSQGRGSSFWQFDANRRYHYVRDDGGDRTRDVDFQVSTAFLACGTAIASH
jgi:hypothetical protein